VKSSKASVVVLLFWSLMSAQALPAAEDFKGSWTIMPSESPGQVRFGVIHHPHGGNSQSESDWPISAFQGVVFGGARHDVKFSITRDAGRFDCEGFLNEGEGAGIFHFTLDGKYAQAMGALGFSGIDDEKQFAMAVHDVSLDFARTIKGEKLEGMDTDKLIAFRIFNVTPQFIHDLRAEGLPATDSDKLVAFRIHGVSPRMIREVRKAGLQPGEDQLIAMRIHGVSPEWIAQLHQDGYDDLDIDKMIAFRIHGVSPQFIEKIAQLGYPHPEPDQLVAMRIHGVTPEFISDLKSRGMQNLTIDQLVNLRIHDID
jgi:hypothetical protein